MYYNFSKFYILKSKRNGKQKPTGTAGEHPAPRPRNKNRGGTCGTLGEGGKIFGTQKTDTTETAGTTTHKNKISHTQKQNGTTTHSSKKTSLKITNKTKQKGKTTQFYIIFFMEMTENKKKDGAKYISVTYAPQFANVLRAKELKKGKNASFLVIYQQGEGDSTGDKIYHLGLYKQVQYAPIRTDGGLAEVLDFVASNYKNVQILNADAYEEKGAK